MPRDNEVEENAAVPFDRETVAIVVEPSLKTTLPVGVPVPGAIDLTVAVNVTLWPKVEGFRDDVSVVDVEARFTVCVSVGEVLAEKFVAPL
jgi:hypothetical protein